MKYQYQHIRIPQEKRKALNEQVLYLLDLKPAKRPPTAPEDIYNAYTGDGGLHGLERKDFSDYHAYGQAKKEIENGQFFTPPALCELIMEALHLSEKDLVADLTCGKGSFFNFLPAEANGYGCELDQKAVKVAKYLYPKAHITCEDIRSYQPKKHFDYVVGNPPFHLRWKTADGTEIPSQLYYCWKAAEVLKPFGIMALLVPQSFLADTFLDGGAIRMMEERFLFLGQVGFPADAFSELGVSRFPTKLQFWQKRSDTGISGDFPYRAALDLSLEKAFDLKETAEKLFSRFLYEAKNVKESSGAIIYLELAKRDEEKREFVYEAQKLLYQIKAHPKTHMVYNTCCEYLRRYYTQTQPSNLDYEEWERTRITEEKILFRFKRVIGQQNKPPGEDKIALIKRGAGFAYKGYSAKAKEQIKPEQYRMVPTHEAVISRKPEDFPGYERLIRRKQEAYRVQEQPFAAMEEKEEIAQWLSQFTLWDSRNIEQIRLNELQRHDINLILQKRYSLLQWEQGSGKTLAGIAAGIYRMECQNVHSTWVVSSAISIRNNWNVVLKAYDLPFIFVENLKDLKKIYPGCFVLLTLNMVVRLKKRLCKWLKEHRHNIQFILDESDEICNPSSQRCRSVLACFRRSRMKLLTTGTSTRNNISEFAPQLELLYNNSVNMISWNKHIYKRKKDDEDGNLVSLPNQYFGQPIPAYKKGYSLFSASHLPKKLTVFGLEKSNQDIYNAEVLNRLLAKTVITRTFEEVSGKDIKRLHQIPLRFPPEERAVYQTAMTEFNRIRNHYFVSTGNSRKDSMMKLIQQIVLLLRIGAAPDTVIEYKGGTPVKVMTAAEMIALWENDIVAVGVRHKTVLESYEKAFREYLPDRPLFVVTGTETTFAMRRALQQKLKDSGNGILLCTQQSLPSSVNFEFVNKVLLPELHYNHAGMSQFYFRFIRYNSTEQKDIYFLTYAESIESNLLQMILSKEKLTLFMKGQDVDLDEVYERFNIDYDLMSLLMKQEKDDQGRLRIRWGAQTIA